MPAIKFRGVDFIQFDSLLTEEERLVRMHGPNPRWGQFTPRLSGLRTIRGFQTQGYSERSSGFNNLRCSG